MMSYWKDLLCVLRILNSVTLEDDECGFAGLTLRWVKVCRGWSTKSSTSMRKLREFSGTSSVNSCQQLLCISDVEIKDFPLSSFLGSFPVLLGSGRNQEGKDSGSWHLILTSSELYTSENYVQITLVIITEDLLHALLLMCVFFRN